MSTINTRAGQWNPMVKSVIRAIDETGVDKVVSEHGSTENYALVKWFLPPNIAAIVFEHYSR